MTPAGEPDRGRSKAADRALATRAALIDLAADMFSTNGYVQTSMRDIARRGALTTGAIYGHFRNKADLLVEAINTFTAEELEAQTMGAAGESNYIETLTGTARDFRKRRRLRALIVQGAAAAHTDDETRTKLRDEQLAHLNVWIKGYERDRERLGIHRDVDLQAAVVYTWAVEVGLGVLEAVGIEPKSAKGWADVHNRMARSLQLEPEASDRAPRRRTARKTSS